MVVNKTGSRRSQGLAPGARCCCRPGEVDDFLRLADRLARTVVELVNKNPPAVVVGQRDGETSGTLQVVLDEVGKARFAEFVATP